MSSVHQLLPAAVPHDAITGQAFAWRDLLRSWGYESEIVAEHVDPELIGTAHILNRAGKRLVNEGGLLLRYALWSATAEAGLRANGPTALCYHNITPGELLRDFNPALADLCDRGRAALAGFREESTRSSPIPASTPPSFATKGWAMRSWCRCWLEPPMEIPRREPNREPIVMTVGRIVPNKRLDDVMKAFALYQRRHAPEASLVIVGSHVGFESYRTALEDLAARMGVRQRLLHRPDLVRGSRRLVSQRGRVPLDVGARGLLCATDRGPRLRDAGGGARCGRRARDAGRRRRRPRRR